MRKLWSIMLVLILAVGLVGCSSSGEESYSGAGVFCCGTGKQRGGVSCGGKSV